MNTKLLLAAIVAALLTACDSSPSGPAPIDTPLQVHQPLEADKSRFTIKIMSQFRDEMAYGNKRGVYLITDTKTKREFVGVSGIGISELGQHSELAGFDEDGVPEYDDVADER